MIDRTAIYAALWAKLSGLPGYVTTERRLRHWTDVSSSEMPYLCMAQGNQQAQTVKQQPTIWTLQSMVWVYVRTDGAQVPGDVMNPLINDIEAALAPPPGQATQTLGGTVSHCWIEGEVITDEGTLGDIAVARVPIFIRAA